MRARGINGSLLMKGSSDVARNVETETRRIPARSPDRLVRLIRRVTIAQESDPRSSDQEAKKTARTLSRR